MYWQIRWLRNAIWGCLPFNNALRRIKRSISPYPTRISSWTLEEGFRIIRLLHDSGCNISGSNILEIGSGRLPIIPILFSLSGAKKICTIDIQRFMDRETFIGAVYGLRLHSALISDNIGASESEINASLCFSSADFNTLLQHFRIEYTAPCNLITSNLTNGDYDIITSRAVLEHIPYEILLPLLTRSYNLLRSGGWTCHAIDNSDHYSHIDKKISRVNFLRFSDRKFNFINKFNPEDYQNRLRHSEYREIFLKIGFQILNEYSIPEDSALNDLRNLTLDSRFQKFSMEDLAVLDSYFVGRRP